MPPATMATTRMPSPISSGALELSSSESAAADVSEESEPDESSARPVNYTGAPAAGVPAAPDTSAHPGAG